MTRRGQPLLTETRYQPPEPGQLIAFDHAVYRVEAVKPAPTWTDRDQRAWEHAGSPDPDTWPDRPIRLEVRYLGGHRPADLAADHTEAALTASAGWTTRRGWNVYAGDRWPQCSCCGEPMPCRAEQEDAAVTAGLDRIAALEAVMPGSCWACNEPVSQRQDAVVYPGENLLLPGREQVVFHIRSRCRPSAQRYEQSWLAADPGRERILTWPRCGGILVVHGDGSSECVTGVGPLGRQHTSQPDCQGHLTHDHGMLSACFVRRRWLSRPADFPGCPRGCPQDGHPGTRAYPPRPDRRDRPADADPRR